MAKYSRFDPKNKKRSRDKYRSEKKNSYKSLGAQKRSNNITREASLVLENTR